MTTQRVLMVFTIMNRGGAETMVMNYYRHMDRSRLPVSYTHLDVYKRQLLDYAVLEAGCRGADQVAEASAALLESLRTGAGTLAYRRRQPGVRRCV